MWGSGKRAKNKMFDFLFANCPDLVCTPAEVYSLFGAVTQREGRDQSAQITHTDTQSWTSQQDLSVCYQTNCHVSACSSAMNQQHTEMEIENSQKDREMETKRWRQKQYMRGPVIPSLLCQDLTCHNSSYKWCSNCSSTCRHGGWSSV